MTRSDSAMYARRAIESLRSGVPSAPAVESLGIDEPVITGAFGERLEALSRRDDKSISGFFIEGDFGTGKSHILRYFEMLSIKRKLATSSVTISKETPLGDLPAMFRSAIANLKYPDGHIGGSLAELFERLDTNSAAYAAFFRKVCSEAAGLDPLFEASVLLYDQHHGDPEVVEQLVEFWDGGQPQVAAWRKLLKYVDGAPKIRATSARDLAIQRFCFVSLALRAANFAGWLITIDEIELMAKFTLPGRTKAYAVIDKLFNLRPPVATINDGGLALGGTIVVGAITTDLIGELLNSRDERNFLPRQARLTEEVIASALSGLEALASSQWRYAIRPDVDLQRTWETVRALYLTAYARDLPKPDVLGEYGSFTRRRNIRQNIRSWISSWDLRRLDPSYVTNMVADDLVYDLSEDQDIGGGGDEPSFEPAV